MEAGARAQRGGAGRRVSKETLSLDEHIIAFYLDAILGQLSFREVRILNMQTNNNTNITAPIDLLPSRDMVTAGA